MVGSTAMTLHGWRQLAEWSIEFSCLSEPEKAQAMAIFRREWEVFCGWIETTFGAHADSLSVSL
jgi:adenosine deaminase CECR1